MEGGELGKAEERYGETEESRGQWSVWCRLFLFSQGSRSLTNSDQLFSKDWLQANHIREFLPTDKLLVAIAKSGKVC